MNTPSTFLDTWLGKLQPQHILCLGDNARKDVESYCKKANAALTMATPSLNLASLTALPDAAVVTGTLEKLAEAEGEHLLGELRNHLIPNLLVYIPEDHSTWTFNRMIALGFRKAGTFETRIKETDGQKATLSRALACYSYDILEYNHKRSWNNAEHWANPELFGKYWW